MIEFDKTSIVGRGHKISWIMTSFDIEILTWMIINDNQAAYLQTIFQEPVKSRTELMKENTSAGSLTGVGGVGLVLVE